LHQHFSVDLKEEPVAHEGWNWGEIDIEQGSEGANGRDLRFSVNGKVGFDLPVSAMRQVNVSKSDVVLELDAGGADHSEEVPMEMRLAVPGAGAPSLTATALRDELQRRAGLGTTGTAIARFSDVSIVAPRGKHELGFFAHGLKIRGKSQSYTIQYSNIARLFLLELEKDKRWAIVVGLDSPLRQGKTLHQALVLTFDDTSVMVELPEDFLKEFGYKDGQESPAFKVVGEVLKKMSGKMMAAPSSEFKELHPHKVAFLKCSHKASSGHLFFCKQSCMFVVKPVMWFKYSEVGSVGFGSGQMRGRTFDLVLNLKVGGAVEFTQIDSQLLDATVEFLRKVGLVVEDTAPIARGRPRADGAAAQKQAGAYRTRGARPGAAPRAGEDFDADDPEDEDFEGSSDGEGGASSSSSSDSGVPRAKRPKLTT